MTTEPKETCKKCNTPKTKILKKKQVNGSKVWMDETGSVWCGKKCPDCYRELINRKARLRYHHKKELAKEIA